MVDFTVAIPTYNSEHRLPLFFDRLEECLLYTERSKLCDISIEVIIVDNNSGDRTAKIIKNYRENWQSKFSLIYCFEAKQGAAFARQHAVRVAKGEFIGFLDDDNLPAPSWIVRSYLFGKLHTQAGAYGGKIYANYEVLPPENFDRIEGFLAIRDRGEYPNLYQPEVLSLPPGAAMVVRRQAWLDCVPQRPKLGGKSAGFMVQGDDWEPLIYLYKSGWEIWYNPEMTTEHQIPAFRLDRDYLIHLIRGSCLCFIPLKMMFLQPWQKPISIAKTVLGNSYKAARHYIQYRNVLKSDLVKRCELQIYLSRIESVFYYFSIFNNSRL